MEKSNGRLIDLGGDARIHPEDNNSPLLKDLFPKAWDRRRQLLTDHPIRLPNCWSKLVQLLADYEQILDQTHILPNEEFASL